MSDVEPQPPERPKFRLVPKPPVLTYAELPERQGLGMVLLEIAAGVGGYLLLAGLTHFGFGTAIMSMTSSGLALLALTLLPPLAVVGAAAYFLKARTMMLSALITFGALALSCGTCYALFSRL